MQLLVLRINDLKHEFGLIEGLREDILEVLLNLKEVIFKSSFSTHQSKQDLRFKGYLKVKGPIVVNAGMFQLTKR